MILHRITRRSIEILMNGADGGKDTDQTYGKGAPALIDSTLVA